MVQIPVSIFVEGIQKRIKPREAKHEEEEKHKTRKEFFKGGVSEKEESANYINIVEKVFNNFNDFIYWKFLSCKKNKMKRQ